MKIGLDTEETHIKELEKLELLLNKTERLQNIVHYLPLGVMLMDSDEKILLFNEQFLKLTGLAGNIAGKKCYELDKSQVCKVLQVEVILLITEAPFYKKISLPDGRKLGVRAVPVGDNKKQLLLLLEDITEAERDRTWLEGITAILTDSIIVVDREMNIVWANDIAKSWFDETGLLGAKCYMVVHKTNIPTSFCPAVQTFNDGNIHYATERIKTKDGDEKVIDIATGPIFDHEGNVHRVVEIKRDVTRRERVIQDLETAMMNMEELNKQLNQKISRLSMLMQIADTLQSTDNLHHILHIILTGTTARQGVGFNRAFLLLADEESRTLQGKYAIGPSTIEEAGRVWGKLAQKQESLQELLSSYSKIAGKIDIAINELIKAITIPLDDSDNVLIRSLDKHQYINFTTPENQLPAGSRMIAELIGTDRFAVIPIYTSNRNIGVMIVDNKITGQPIVEDDLEFTQTIATHAGLAIERAYLAAELKEKYKEASEMYQKLEENQRQLIEAERLSTIGQMAAQLAHEIKNPLVAVGGFARNILRRADELQPDTVRKLGIIQKETLRIENIVSDLLHLAKVQKPKFVPCNINKIIQRAANTVEVEAQNKDVRLTLLLNETRAIAADHEQLLRLMLNLLTNAIAACAEGGEVSVTTEQQESIVLIEVTDTGAGIPDEFKNKIFEPFFTTKSTGTGLGLAISAQIVTAHKGRIWFTSEGGKGTVFHIILPIKEEIS